MNKKEEEIELIKKDINKKTALIFSLADIQEELVVDIISKLKTGNLYQFDVKKLLILFRNKLKSLELN